MLNERNRAARLSLIQHFLHKHPAGLTSKELAGMCDTTVRTIQRDLLILQSDMHVPVTENTRGRYGILKDHILPPVAYTLYETLVLFLAARLMIRQTDEFNPHIKSALEKLVSMMPGPLAAQLNQSVKYLGQKQVNAQDVEIFEKVSMAWSTRKRLRIVYKSMHRRKTEEWRVNPYFVEMTGVGFSIYLIGYAESGAQTGINTFKLNRIKEVEILDEDFEIPHELKINELLSSSWGVMWGENVRIKLRFSAAVAPRVRESIWHPSQVIEDCPDGGCLMSLNVGSTLEMSPWLRGWGPEVEVLEPPELRAQFKGWAERLQKMYCRK